MTGSATVKESFEELRACVIIPTYNNATTLEAVIRDVNLFTDHIIVVNDGSTDNTLQVIEQFPAVQLVTYPKNVGKGWALRKAFEYAISRKYDFGIAIDSDGQHFAKDLPTFVEKVKVERSAIIIGARNMNQASVPGKSSFGYKFSNFWFKVETGINCPDTQSGYRLYPLWLLKDMQFFTRKYEFEIEVLVRAAWDGIKVIAVPVSVYYPPQEERITHFRPFKDFTRISILNTVLVLITFLYIKPRDFFKGLVEKKKWAEFFNEQLINPAESNWVKACSVAFGVFMGIVPIWGFQLIVAIALSFVLKLNKILVVVAANISLPPMIPVIIFLSYKMGAYWMGPAASQLNFDNSITLASIQKNLLQYVYGSITLAIFAGLFAGLFTLLLLRLFNRKSILTG